MKENNFEYAYTIYLKLQTQQELIAVKTSSMIRINDGTTDLRYAAAPVLL